MSRTDRALALNIGVVVAAVVAAAALIWVTGNLVFLIVILAVAGSATWNIVRIFRRPDEASDVDRLNSMKYLDERDRSLALQAFGIVGIVALVLTVVTALVTLFTDALGAEYIALVQFVVLFGSWAAANSYVTRKQK
ncbi:hypothetical protein [Cryobacterium sp. W22_MBD10_FK3]|uniref:hypothetical protein n=1 Tax=Cryobacterium sp. W22_MBD10_FK3 TaxID=3240273 RepID=UPI003F8DB5C6